MAAKFINRQVPMAERCTFCKRVGRIPSVLAVLVVGMVSLPGCGKSSKTVSIEGAITYEGKKVTDGIINFLPEKGRPLGGGIESDGTYSVKLPPGKYQVRIDAPAPLPEGFKEGMPLPKPGPPLVPEKYANFASSGLTATVGDQSQQQIDFALP
jgi:hypothetical protein